MRSPPLTMDTSQRTHLPDADPKSVELRSKVSEAYRPTSDRLRSPIPIHLRGEKRSYSPAKPWPTLFI
jgi:hypothetical protein